MLMERLRRNDYLLNGYFLIRAIERTCAAKPLVRDNPKGVLVACRARFATRLLRSHIRNRARYIAEAFL